MESGHITHLQRRAIQARLAACLIHAFAAELGWERALEIASAAVQADARAAGESAAEQRHANSLKELADIVRHTWAQDDALNLHVLEETPYTFSFDVTRCRYAEFYEQAGMLELGFCLSCCRDEAFASGFNAHIRLKRTQTLMQGAPVCDFRFSLDEC